MSEPNTMVGAGALAALIALAGPLLGPYIVVVLLSSGGALVAASEVETTGRFHVMAFVFRGFVFGLGFASASADFVAGYLHVAAPVALAPVSLVIGLYAHRWRSVGPIVWSLIVRLRGAPGA